MTLPIANQEDVFDEQQYTNSIAQVETPTWDVMGAAFEEAWLDNPVMSTFRISELNELRAGGEEERISQQNFNERYSSLGLRWDNEMTWAAAAELGSRKIRERQNQFIMQAGEGGFFEGTAVIGSALVASFLDPVNIVLALTPIVAAPKYAQLGAKAGSRISSFMSQGLFKADVLAAKAAGGSTWARMQIGAIDGFAGALIAEPITAFARNQEQADYGLTNALHNVMLGTFMGAGLHAGIGKVSDLYSAFGMRKLEADIRETESAVKQLLDGKTVDTAGLHASQDAEITVLNRFLDDAEGLTPTDINSRAMDLGELPEVEIIGRQKAGVEVQFKGDDGRGLTAFGKDVDTAQKNLIAEYQRMKIEELTVDTKRTAQQLQNRLEKLVGQRNQLRDAISKRGTPEGQENLGALRNRLERLNESDALDLKLDELGLSTRDFNEVDAKIKALLKQRDDVVKFGKGKKKKLKKIDQELAELENQRGLIKGEFDQPTFVKARELLRDEKAALRKQIKQLEVAVEPQAAKAQLKKVEKQIENTLEDIHTTAMERTQQTLLHQQNAEGQLFFTPEPDAPTRLAAEATTRASDVSEVEKAFKKIDDELTEDLIKGLPEDLKKTIRDTSNLTAFFETASEAQRKGIACLMGLTSG